jgi:hypothetical protein
MDDIYNTIGVNIDDIKRKPKAIQLAKKIKNNSISINMLSEIETNELIICFLIALR